MITRSMVRQACAKAMSGSMSEKHKEIWEVVSAKLPIHCNKNNFTSEWDIAVDRSGEIHIIKPEVDRDFVAEVALEAKLKKKNNLPWEWNARQQNIIDIINTELMEGVTSWENYGEAWTIDVDVALKRVSIRLLNRNPGQSFPEPKVEVIKETVESPVVEVSNFTPMSDPEKAIIETMMKKKKFTNK